jgi:hypothetical protein
MEIEFRKQDLDRINKLLIKGVDQPLRDSIFDTMNFAETRAKTNIRKSVYDSPRGQYVRTGKAQQSIIGQMQGRDRARIFMGAGYGKYLEEGTGIPAGRSGWFTAKSNVIPGASGAIYIKGMKARPFWKPMVEATQKEAPKIMKRTVDSYIRKNV